MRYVLIILSLFLLAFDYGTLLQMDRLLGEDLSTFPGILPCEGKIGSRFGVDRGDHLHAGIDIPGIPGTVIHATGAGTVEYSGWSPGRGGYGLHVIIDHGNGFKTVYGHMRTRYVSTGDKVERGQPIGEMGFSGYCRPKGPRGCHTHYGVKLNGNSVDPMRYIVR